MYQYIPVNPGISPYILHLTSNKVFILEDILVMIELACRHVPYIFHRLLQPEFKKTVYRPLFGKLTICWVYGGTSTDISGYFWISKYILRQTPFKSAWSLRSLVALVSYVWR
jgi:hypothetical protein